MRKIMETTFNCGSPASRYFAESNEEFLASVPSTSSSVPNIGEGDSPSLTPLQADLESAGWISFMKLLADKGYTYANHKDLFDFIVKKLEALKPYCNTDSGCDFQENIDLAEGILKTSLKPDDAFDNWWVVTNRDLTPGPLSQIDTFLHSYSRQKYSSSNPSQIEAPEHDDGSYSFAVSMLFEVFAQDKTSSISGYGENYFGYNDQGGTYRKQYGNGALDAVYYIYNNLNQYSADILAAIEKTASGSTIPPDLTNFFSALNNDMPFASHLGPDVVADAKTCWDHQVDAYQIHG